jgi:hypothetical protein
VKKRSVVPALIVVMIGLCRASFAASEYVIANANNRPNNSLVVYELDTEVGSLTQIAMLPTGGNGLGPGGPPNMSNVGQAISPNAACVFALDPGIGPSSTDIAAFSKANGYAKVGNYSNVALQVGDSNGSLALTPNGKFLYASYSETENVGVWAVNADCSLTFVAAYPPGAAGAADLKVTPDGAYLVASYGNAELFAINENDGTLTDIGSLSGPICPQGCLIVGVDFTKDSKIAIFAGNWGTNQGYDIPVAVSARVTPTGFKEVRGWELEALNDSPFLAASNIPFFSAAGYAGSGNLYFGMYGGEGFPGVLTTSFTESPLQITVTNATVIDPTIYDGAIAATGNLMVVAEYPTQIGVFSINPDGSLTELSTTPIGTQDPGMFSLSIFPNTR